MGDMTELEPQPNVVPAACEDGHISWPARYIRLGGEAVYAAESALRAGSCPGCGKPRAIIPGEYRADPDGYVTRDGQPVPDRRHSGTRKGTSVS
jgi:hypothetical protein